MHATRTASLAEHVLPPPARATEPDAPAATDAPTAVDRTRNSRRSIGSLIGIALGGSFGLALLFIVLRSPDSETATELSGMAQSIGYFLAAIGPTLFGALHDFTDAWFIPLLFLLVLITIKLYAGLGAARPKAIK